MSAETTSRLFGYRHAFDHPLTLWICVAVGVLLVLAPLVIHFITRLGSVEEKTRTELFHRWSSWVILAILIFVPVLLGAAWTIGAVTVLSLLCFSEYARATGLFRERLITGVVVLGILAVMFSALDHWYDFFMALAPLAIGTIAVAGVLTDHPKGYVQRVALGVFGFMLFGSALGHLAYFSNDKLFRPLILFLVLTVELNDVFGYVIGKPLGKRKLAPHTSPGKTVAGAVGAVVCTTLIVIWLGKLLFQGTALDSFGHLVLLGIIISTVGQLGDLMLSSIKRDLGLKDMGSTIPGHGGVLDRFDSLILASPAVFHYIGYYRGIGLDQPARIFTG